MRKQAGLGALLVGVVFAVGCSSGLQLRYHPTTPPGTAARANVALKVVDQRPPEKLAQPTRVGSVRGSFAIPQPVEDRNADVAPHTVGDATADALLRAGVGVQGGPKTLVATVKEFWMDGFVGYKATVGVVYELVDAGGRSLWTATVQGNAGGNNMFKSGNSMTYQMFDKALGELAAKASGEFASPAFQQALAQQ